ncbi:MAG: polysaccharide pyruvyl transferase family protein [Ignavibacteria bacterium]|nr:polysaccharide pyruvyl transferase family protein [Ignavibacteria bacterium]
MNIGILTYHSAYNFGANLQTLSTVSYLRNCGYDPIIVDFQSSELERKYDIVTPSPQAQVFKQFLHLNFNLTSRCENSTEIAAEIEKANIESVIIGSDAVVQHHSFLSRLRVSFSRKKIFRVRVIPPNYETTFPNPFWGEFLDFLEKDNVTIMMSVSCQNTDYQLFPRRIRRDIYKYLLMMNYISVRDLRTRDMMTFVSGGNLKPPITPDPVFAFNQNVSQIPSREEIIKRYNLPEKYVLLSFHSSKTVSVRWINGLMELFSLHGIECVAFPMPTGIMFQNDLRYKIKLPLDPIDWYCLIKYSCGYIGEKMHPIVVALHNIVPFFSFDHYGINRFNLFSSKYGSKIYHILNKAEFLDNRASSVNSHYNPPPSPAVVFDKICNFDTNKCQKFSSQMLAEYNQMMLDICKVLDFPRLKQ